MNDFDLEKDDIIDVKRNPNLFTNKSVIINGEVLVPGYYTLLNSEERISTLLKRSGNVTAFGNLQAARIFRKSELELIQNSVSQQLKQIRKPLRRRKHYDNFIRTIRRDCGSLRKRPRALADRGTDCGHDPLCDTPQGAVLGS
jgi:protein involved in polysaccharide export with SLBB domain